MACEEAPDFIACSSASVRRRILRFSFAPRGFRYCVFVAACPALVTRKNKGWFASTPLSANRPVASVRVTGSTPRAETAAPATGWPAVANTTPSTVAGPRDLGLGRAGGNRIALDGEMGNRCE